MVIKNAQIVTNNKIVLGYVVIENNLIKEIKAGGTSLEGIDANKKYLIPSFIDSHTHGGYGLAFNNIKDFDSKLVKKYLDNVVLKEGVSGILMALVTDSFDNIKQCYDNYNKVKELDSNDIIKGIYLEGPFLDVARKGAQNPALILDMTRDNVKEILNDNVKVITVSPNNDECIKAIEMYKNNTIMSIGHSSVSMAVAKKAIAAGVKRVTHFYNGMSKFDHREPGIMNEILANTGLDVELIVDGHHINPEVVKETIDILNYHKNRIVFISDSISMKGCPDGNSLLGALPVVKKGDFCNLVSDNSIAGSAMAFNKVVATYADFSKDSIINIAKYSATNPAKSINLKKEGEIKVGYKANMLIVDEKLSIKNIIINGKLVK